MLRCLKGTVLSVESGIVVLEVGGLGFEVHCSRRALELCQPDCETRLYVFLQIQETGAAVFGFADAVERDLFRCLTAVRGVGGKMALAMLREISPAAVVKAIDTSDTRVLTQVPGVGKKTAERLCFEMKGHLDAFVGLTHSESFPISQDEGGNFVLEALKSLGFGHQEASLALSEIRKRRGLSSDNDVADEAQAHLLQEALKELNRM